MAITNLQIVKRWFEMYGLEISLLYDFFNEFDLNRESQEAWAKHLVQRLGPRLLQPEAFVVCFADAVPPQVVFMKPPYKIFDEAFLNLLGDLTRVPLKEADNLLDRSRKILKRKGLTDEQIASSPLIFHMNEFIKIIKATPNAQLYLSEWDYNVWNLVVCKGY